METGLNLVLKNNFMYDKEKNLKSVVILLLVSGITHISDTDTDCSVM